MDVSTALLVVGVCVWWLVDIVTHWGPQTESPWVMCALVGGYLVRGLYLLFVALKAL